MRRLFLSLALGLVALLLLHGPVLAGPGDVKPTDVKVEVNNNENFARYKGLKVRVNQKDDEFFSHSFFITYADLQDLARKRRTTCSFTPGSRTVKIGDRTLDIIAVDPKSKEDFLFSKVRSINYQGKTYFDLWNVYGGLGFTSVSKTTGGVYLYDPKLPKKK